VGASFFALITDLPPEEVVEFYASEMVELGWEETATGLEESQAMFSARYLKGDRSIQVEIDSDGAPGTSIQITSGDPALPFAFPRGS
jgi:hypothetical protein